MSGSLRSLSVYQYVPLPNYGYLFCFFIFVGKFTSYYFDLRKKCKRACDHFRAYLCVCIAWWIIQGRSAGSGHDDGRGPGATGAGCPAPTGQRDAEKHDNRRMVTKPLEEQQWRGQLFTVTEFPHKDMISFIFANWFLSVWVCQTIKGIMSGLCKKHDRDYVGGLQIWANFS